MFNFVITETCNWKCGYCVFPELQSKAKHTSKEIIDKHINYINELLDKIDPDIVTVEGGEIGHVPEYILEYFFERINRKIEVSTNGQFLRRELHKNEFIRPKIKKIMLHVADIITTDKIELDYDIDDPDIPIENGVVDINKNPEMVKQFLEANQHIMFHYIDYEHDICGPVSGLNISYGPLYDAIKDAQNVTKDAKERILRRYKRNVAKDIKMSQDMCKKLHPCVFIDLVNETIPLCIRNYLRVYSLLNRKNLESVITDLGVFDYTNATCDSCYRICQDVGIGIEQVRKRSEYKKRLNE